MMTDDEDQAETQHNENPNAEKSGRQHPEPNDGGYAADASANSKSGNDDSDWPNSNSNVGQTNDKLGLVIEFTSRSAKRRRRSKNKKNDSSTGGRVVHHRRSSTSNDHSGGRKRKRSDSRNSRRQRPKKHSTPSSSSLPAPSPIHPEIDISLTQHIAVKNGLLLRPTTDSVLQRAAVCVVGGGGSNSSSSQNDTTTNEMMASSVPALSNAVLQYFADLRQDIAADDKTQNTKKSKRSKEFNQATPKTSKETAMQHASPKAQLISDVASFSDEPYKLEDALEITNTPRLLLEGTSPHRIIHVNAAFSKHVIMAGSSSGRRRHGRYHCNNTQEWIESQNELSSLSTNARHRSLQQAIETIIPENASLPLTCYPVLGSGKKAASHYLIEAATISSTAVNDIAHRRRHQDTMPQLYKPFEAIG